MWNTQKQQMKIHVNFVVIYKHLKWRSYDRFSIKVT